MESTENGVEVEPEPAATWALQLVARVEKRNPPDVADICGAAALSVIRLLSDDRASASDGPWHNALVAWQETGRIRKLTRRARGEAWRKAQFPDGVTAVVGSGEVRAYVPSPMDALPDEIRKLQIQSSPLPSPPRVDDLASITDSGSEHPKPTLLIVMTPEVDMSWGKQAAQAAHAGQLLWAASTAPQREDWRDVDGPIMVIHASEMLWNAAVAEAEVHVRDGGFTEIPAGTMTAVAWWLR